MLSSSTYPKWLVLVIVVVSAATFATTTDAALATTGFFDENVVQVNTVDVSATTYTVNDATIDVAAAFTLGTGGVIDFDQGTITDPNRIEATFGVGGSGKTLHLRNDARTWGIGNLGTGTAGAISGSRVLFNGAPDPFPTPYLNRVIFEDVTDTTGASTGEVVTMFGFVALDLNSNLNGGINNLDLTVTFSDNTTTSLMHTIPTSFNLNDTYFGFEASPGLSITQVDFTATNNLATDDWTFIVAAVAVPEPSSFAILGMAGAFVIFGRRKRQTQLAQLPTKSNSLQHRLPRSKR